MCTVILSRSAPQATAETFGVVDTNILTESVLLSEPREQSDAHTLLVSLASCKVAPCGVVVL